jgi:hypothetical protein
MVRSHQAKEQRDNASPQRTRAAELFGFDHSADFPEHLWFFAVFPSVGCTLKICVPR